MRFWFMVVLILGIAALCLRSCVGKIMGATAKPAVGKVVGGASGALGIAAHGTPVTGSEIPASRIYTFKHREPPTSQELSTVGGKGGQASFTVDAMSRTVMVCGSIVGVAFGMDYLQAIDVMPCGCGVRTWAVYVDKSAAKGWDLVAAIKSVAGAAGGGSLTVGNGGAVLNYNVGDIAAALNIICDGTVVYVCQKPHVQLLQGETARIESLQQVPVPSTTVSQGMSQTSVQYIKVGLSMEITPYFTSNGRIKLDVSQSNGLIGQNVKIGDNQIPIIQSQLVSATVTMSIGETVVLGGVTTLREETDKGWLRDKKTVTEGNLYVILSTYPEEPRALPVGDPLDDIEGKPPMGPVEQGAAWLDKELPLLPRKGWQDDEKAFIQERAGTPQSKKTDFPRAGH